jgi:FixJ family two-component response regulator
VLAAGAIAFLSKPVGEKSLSDCLKTALIRGTN